MELRDTEGDSGRIRGSAEAPETGVVGMLMGAEGRMGVVGDIGGTSERGKYIVFLSDLFLMWSKTLSVKLR